MFARRVRMRLKSNCIVKLTETFDTEIIPMLRKLKGFQDEITFVTQSGSEAFAISLWDRAENAEVYNHTIYPAVVKIVSKYRIGPTFTPIVVSKPEGPYGTILTTGVTNWPGGSWDPETHILYVHASTGIVSNGLVPGDPKRTEFAWMAGNAAPDGGGRGESRGGGGLRVQGLPLLKPPYGSIVAIDMDKGEILWKIANAETPDNVRNHPALKGLNIPRTGRQSNTIGMLVTKTLMIAGEPGMFTMPDGRQGAMLRAYDKVAGRELGAVAMPAGQTGTPMTYMLNGKQYLVLAIGGPGYPGEFLAFALPGK